MKKQSSDADDIDKLMKQLVKYAMGQDVPLDEKLDILDRAQKWHLIKHKTADDAGSGLDNLGDED